MHKTIYRIEYTNKQIFKFIERRYFGCLELENGTGILDFSTKSEYLLFR